MENRSTTTRINKTNRTVVRSISESLGKLPPQALDLEEAILGAIMLEKQAYMSVSDFLKVEHFYSEQHQEIYRSMESLARTNSPIDMRTVVAELRAVGKIELIGGAYYIAELTSKVSSAANIEYHARIIIELAVKRELIQIASSVNNDAYEDTTDVFELLDKTEKLITRLVPFNTRNVSNAKAILLKTVESMKTKKENHGVTGIPTGYTDLDKITAGFHNSELTIIAARPGMGKTALLVNILLKISINFNIPVAFFSLEMSELQLGYRIVSILSEIEMERIIRSNMGEHDWKQLMEKTSRFGTSPLYVDDTSALSIFDLKVRAKRLKEEMKIKMIVVDYLQLMVGEKGGNREQEISSISRGLKQIAKDLDIPVVALSQLSRSVETRGGDKRPMLSDLRESGSIEQDADVVAFIYRPEYYGINTDESGNPMQGVMEVIYSKNRQGKLDHVPLKFIGKFTKVTDFYHTEPPPGFKPVSEVRSEIRNPSEPDREQDDLPF